MTRPVPPPPSRPALTDQAGHSMTAGEILAHLTPDELCAVVRAFVVAVESGAVERDELIPAADKAAMRALFPVIERLWDGA